MQGHAVVVRLKCHATSATHRDAKPSEIERTHSLWTRLQDAVFATMADESKTMVSALEVGGFDTDTMTVCKGLTDDNMEKLLTFKQTVERLVSTYVHLIPEESTESKMMQLLKVTKVGQLPEQDCARRSATKCA
jgi:hypothetical protein